MSIPDNEFSLDNAPKEPQRELVPGDVVELLCGGVLMVVEKVNSSSGRAMCTWHDQHGQAVATWYQPVVLILRNELAERIMVAQKPTAKKQRTNGTKRPDIIQ